jgi:hypothetical protein
VRIRLPDLQRSGPQDSRTLILGHVRRRGSLIVRDLLVLWRLVAAFLVCSSRWIARYYYPAIAMCEKLVWILAGGDIINVSVRIAIKGLGWLFWIIVWLIIIVRWGISVAAALELG